MSTSALDERSLNDVQVVRQGFDQSFHGVSKHGLVDIRRSAGGHLVGRLADPCFSHPPSISLGKQDRGILAGERDRHAREVINYIKVRAVESVVRFASCNAAQARSSKRHWRLQNGVQIPKDQGGVQTKKMSKRRGLTRVRTGVAGNF